MAVSVRISGKRGKVTVHPKDGATVADVVREAVETLGIDGFNTDAIVFVVDGHDVPGNHKVGEATNVDAAPQARLG